MAFPGTLSTMPKEVDTQAWAVNIEKGDYPESSSKTENFELNLNPFWPMPMPNLETNLKLRKVDKELRKTNENFFNPSAVSLGPYHYEQEKYHLENLKQYAIEWFVSLRINSQQLKDVIKEVAEKMYREFVEKSEVSNLRDCYNEPFSGALSDDNNFMNMMFKDGCFILYFMDLQLNKNENNKLPKGSHFNQDDIMCDLYLLENQIPYGVLKALINLMPQPYIAAATMKAHVKRFANTIFLNYDQFHHIDKEKGRNLGKKKQEEPSHLLDFLLMELSRGREHGDSDSSNSSFNSNYFRTVTELNAAGINFSKSRTCHLKNVKYRRSCLRGNLSLPGILLSHVTKTALFNLMAYESSWENSECIVTSYMCFLQTLINKIEDVEVLRSQLILLNRLGSDKEVVKLFNELPKAFLPNPLVYIRVMESIENHCKGSFNRFIGQMLETYFSSKWAGISFVIGFFFGALTIYQAFFDVTPFKKN